MLKETVVALVAAVGAASCSTGGPAAVRHQTYIYTCCRASDLSRPLHPGQTLTMHWIVKPGPLSAQPKAAKIRLEASLTGPYQSVTSLKSASQSRDRGQGKVMFTAEPVTTTEWARGHPVTSIAIPATAAAGWYNLTMGVVSGGGRMSGESIVRVTAGS